MNQTLNNKNEEEALRWQFWFSVVFSLLVVVTFALYLPQRFLHQVGEEMDMQMMDGDGEHAGEVHGLSQYHEEEEVKDGISVNLNASPVPFNAGTSTRLDFFVNEKPGNIPVAYDELEIEHAKKMHVIGLRDDMNEFFHIHPVRSQMPEASADPTLSDRTFNGVHPQPVSTPGMLSIDYVFARPGRYKIWSEIKKDGISHSFGHPEMSIQGEGPKSEKNVSLARNVIAGNYQVGLRLPQVVSKGREVELLFDAHTLDSHEIELEPYLGADMHLTIIKDDWKQFIHTHPVRDREQDHHSAVNRDIGSSQTLASDRIQISNGASPEDYMHIPERLIQEALANGGGHDTSEAGHGVMFHANFPEPGLYKMFAQFRPKGIDLPEDEALTAEFWVEVKEGGLAAISAWWLYLIISLVLIVLLSWGVSKYLSVKQ